jgi:hypothetical protein
MELLQGQYPHLPTSRIGLPIFTTISSKAVSDQRHSPLSVVPVPGFRAIHEERAAKRALNQTL